MIDFFQLGLRDHLFQAAPNFVGLVGIENEVVNLYMVPYNAPKSWKATAAVFRGGRA